MKRILWSVLRLKLVLMGGLQATAAAHNKKPEVSSTWLKMHKFYIRQPPHDTYLYDVLHLTPNATSAQINKSYRKLSRQYHPDKQRQQQRSSSSSGSSVSSSQQRLREIREAYDVLKEDRTRLHYHRHGLLRASDAARLLTGGGVDVNLGNSHQNPAVQELLQLMGYYTDFYYDPSSEISWDYVDNSQQDPRMMSGQYYPTTPDDDSDQERQQQEQRVRLVSCQLMERIRPVVEGQLDESYLVQDVLQQCDRLKKLPLGAQILRCIGRAYRYSGQRVLRQYATSKKRPLFVPDKVRDTWREAKHLATAAVAGGRLVFKEQWLLKQQQKMMVSKGGGGAVAQQEEHHPSLTYYNNDHDMHSSMFDDDDDDKHVPTHEEMKEWERIKAETALLESLQVEALWKVCKIDLDRTIREACDLILDTPQCLYNNNNNNNRQHTNNNNDHYYYNHQEQPHSSGGDDGWVGYNGVTVTARNGRIRIASLMVIMGDIMVQRSKEGTSWME